MTNPSTITVTTTVSINGQSETFTVSGETDRNPYRLALDLSETNQGDLQDWALPEGRRWREADENRKTAGDWLSDWIRPEVPR
jgi:hypothetical protein